MPIAAALQMVSSASVQENLNTVSEFFLKAKDHNADLIVLPENFALMGKHETDKFNIAENLGEGFIQEQLQALAKKFNIWIIAGTIPIKSTDNRVKATNLVFDNKGKCAARYDKIHLFDVQISSKEAHHESKTISPGSELVIVDTPIGCVGLTVCYDLRFQELYRKLVEKGADIFTVPSAFTAITGDAHWEILLRARAIENLSYVIAANQGGFHENGRQTYGSTMIIEPWGRILTRFDKGTGLVSAEIDLKTLKRLRKEFPTNEHHVL
ncbi:MAG: carbon-nitrogen hydrolase family protein [Proteobacteria bacterium]|nr:carbon-nitrogen hydrolase family protein [Pseudomonadota bacterium]